MSHAPKNDNWPWRPSATLANLKARAKIIQSIRQFFEARGVMEVETPLLCHTSVTDPFIESIAAHVTDMRTFYLQTSPEYAMKRLLAAGSGPIFQITKAFRQAEIGQHHNPEFTMLEWYRPDFDHHALMDEMDCFLQSVLSTAPAERRTYNELFLTHLQLNVHTASLHDLHDCAVHFGLLLSEYPHDRDTMLQLLLSHLIEPHIGQTNPIFIYDFPATQAMLARIQPSIPPVASRFEVYFKGLELANGFHELQHAEEQRKRFESNAIKRQQLGLAELPIDEYFLAALQSGLPDCAGVALGIDRLVMLAVNAEHLSEVLSFDFTRA